VEALIAAEDAGVKLKTLNYGARLLAFPSWEGERHLLSYKLASAFRNEFLCRARFRRQNDEPPLI
jgi:hypothetical protein